MKIALAQFNPVVGDIKGNRTRIGEFIRRAADGGAELVVLGEMSLLGYPPRDLLRKDGFVAANLKALESLAAETAGIAALVGFVRPTPSGAGRSLQNCAALLADGKVQHVHVKSLLPTYDVFDETRYFEPAPQSVCVEFKGKKLGLSICEDLWDSVALGNLGNNPGRELYQHDPIGSLARAGAEVIINLAASPYEMGKAAHREELFARQAKKVGLPIVYVNQVGGNDELIFDGCSCLVAPDGKIMGRAKSFEEDLLIVDLASETPSRCEPLGDEMHRLSAGLQLGLRDYVLKCGFSSVVLGLSGGIDSAVVAALAAEALGPENVHTLAMPSRYSSDHSLSDAAELAKNLGIGYQVIPIEPMHAAFEQAMKIFVCDSDKNSSAATKNINNIKNIGLAEENIQARVRGSLVMAFSNAMGHLPLATGNKSELSVGYCTLYGDMCGGLAPIGDVLKMQVYQLAHQLNSEHAGGCIPEKTITKPPSAELKPDQTDQDKLPPYEVLDEILKQYVEQDMTAGEIISSQVAGCDDLVRRIVRMVDLSEYKRQQAARVLKISSRAFGLGRRVPIAQRFV